jgi:hypothetical protein
MNAPDRTPLAPPHADGPGEVSSSPYPGLRPFRDRDVSFYFGRGRPIRDVVDRLRRTRFVAVIGGSGSGKSSLVLAGVVPRLRSFGIREAGDFWVPVLTTPGTNHIDGDGPLQRLARKFCAELETRGEADDAKRLKECERILREERDGFGRLVEEFSKQLRNPDHVDFSHSRVQLNFLFLIDQFEELFHPSNHTPRIQADCECLVQRIVDQFRSKHAQVCVAVTMRSEHLNECPRYTDLPDAINEAGYLVKRLDEAQLREAIARPAERFLRMCAAKLRDESVEDEAFDEMPFGDEVSFEAVTQRLIDDSSQVQARPQEHADHLPLLQHLLFWMWQAAIVRCECTVPASIEPNDLCTAVRVAPSGAEDGLPDPSLNTLLACLDNQCEAVFAAHPERQVGWEKVFRCLAFKDPATGGYTQERMSMDALCDRLGLEGADANVRLEALREHLLPWLAPHEYLHWDADSRTIKVTHETLIRRWTRLRDWIDEEDRQFQAYLQLLDAAIRWVPRDGAGYLSADDLARMKVEKAGEAFDDPVRMERIKRLLELDRDGLRLGAVDPAYAKRFLVESEAHVQELRKQAQDQRDRAAAAEAEARAKRTRYISAMGAFAFLSAAAVWATIAEHELSMKSWNLNNGYVLATEAQSTVFATQNLSTPELNLLRLGVLKSEEMLRLEQQKKAWAADAMPWWYGLRQAKLANQAIDVELRNLEAFRSVLRHGAWPVVAGSNGASTDSKDVTESRSCTGEMAGTLFHALPGDPRHRGVLAVSGKISAGTMQDGKCVETAPLVTFGDAGPASSDVGLATDLSNFVYATKNVLVFYELDWSQSGGVSALRKSIRVTGLPTPGGTMKILKSRPFDYGTDVHVAGRWYRLFRSAPSPLSEGVALKGMQMKLQSSDQTTADCRLDGGSPPRAWQVWTLQAPTGEDYRLEVNCVPDKTAAQDPSALPPIYVVTLYRGRAEGRPAGRGGMAYMQLMPAWAIGDSPPKQVAMQFDEGWIAFNTNSMSWVRLPWSGVAFSDMAEELGANSLAEMPSEDANWDFLRTYKSRTADDEDVNPPAQAKSAAR